MKMGPYIKAGLITLFIFVSGIMFGIFIDNFRLSEIRERISRVEVSSLDAMLMSLYFQKFGKGACDIALDTNLRFNQRIYSEGSRIEEAIKVNMFTPELEQEWRRYILLQVQFWFNSVELKKNCNFNYSNVVHLFKLKIEDPQEKALNKLQSQIMLNLKQKCGNKIMLIPITTDSNLSIVDAVVKQHNITKLPAIIIDEEKVFQGLTSLERLNEVTNC
ncbi:MAG: hypothetical protein QXQ18_00435 [Candidatus Aenigmatarchaeota archaeon]